MDYEHQPANHVAFRGASRILLPDALPATSVRRQGAKAAKVIRHPGLKEELYLADFEPDPTVLEQLSIGERPPLLAVARTAPAGASYHRGENPIFLEALRALGSRPEVTTIVLTRLPEQRAAIEALALPSLRVPRHAIDARSLLLQADLFIGAGGTMTREAALLGVPTFSLFSGRPPAVDLALEARGLLRRLTSVGQIEDAPPDGRPAEKSRLERIRASGRVIEDAFVAATMDASR
jgi:predicted glycosyltransferase